MIQCTVEGTGGIGKPDEGHMIIGALNCQKEAEVKIVMFFIENLVKKDMGEKKQTKRELGIELLCLGEQIQAVCMN